MDHCYRVNGGRLAFKDAEPFGRDRVSRRAIAKLTIREITEIRTDNANGWVVITN